MPRPRRRLRRPRAAPGAPRWTGALYLKGSGSTASAIANLFAQDNEAANGGAFYADGVHLTLGSVELNGNEAANGNGGGAYFTNSTVVVTGTVGTLVGEAHLAAQGGQDLDARIVYADIPFEDRATR